MHRWLLQGSPAVKCVLPRIGSVRDLSAGFQMTYSSCMHVYLDLTFPGGQHNFYEFWQSARTGDHWGWSDATSPGSKELATGGKSLEEGLLIVLKEYAALQTREPILISYREEQGDTPQTWTLKPQMLGDTGFRDPSRRYLLTPEGSSQARILAPLENASAALSHILQSLQTPAVPADIEF